MLGLKKLNRGAENGRRQLTTSGQKILVGGLKKKAKGFTKISDTNPPFERCGKRFGPLLQICLGCIDMDIRIKF